MFKKSLVCLSLLVFTFACSSRPGKVQQSKGAKSAVVQDNSKDLVSQLQALSASSNGRLKVVQDKGSLDEILTSCEGCGEDEGDEEEFPEEEGEEFPEEEGEEFPEEEGEESSEEDGEESTEDGEESTEDGEESTEEEGDDDCPEDDEGGDAGEGDEGAGDDEGDEGECPVDEEGDCPDDEEEIPEVGGEDPLPGIDCDEGALAEGKNALINLIKPLFSFLGEDKINEIISVISGAVPDACEFKLKSDSTVTAAIVSKDDTKSAILVDSSGNVKKVKVPSKVVNKLLK